LKGARSSRNAFYWQFNPNECMYAFDPARPDKPTDPLAPFVESITFHEPVRQQTQGDHEQPLRGGKPTIREMSDLGVVL
jgi:hypothetical protein